MKKIGLGLISLLALQACGANSTHTMDLEEYLNRIHIENAAIQRIEAPHNHKAQAYSTYTPEPSSMKVSTSPATNITPKIKPKKPSLAQQKTPTKKRIVKVKKGDQLNKLAQRYGVSPKELIKTNKLRPPYKLLIGQKLVIPQRTIHTVKKGEYLKQIADKHNVSIATLAKINVLKKPYLLKIGQRLRIPSSLGNNTSTKHYVKSQRNTPTKLQNAKTASYTKSTKAVADKGRFSSRTKGPKNFSWPIKGKIISKFGKKGGGVSNEGVNIAANEGERIRAAASGVVVYTGNELKSFGNLVIIRHGGGWLTAYAHQREIFVPKGAIVKKGQVIGRVGASGKVKSPQLHFSVRKGKEAVDPLRVLKS